MEEYFNNFVDFFFTWVFSYVIVPIFCSIYASLIVIKFCRFQEIKNMVLQDIANLPREVFDGLERTDFNPKSDIIRRSGISNINNFSCPFEKYMIDFDWIGHKNAKMSIEIIKDKFDKKRKSLDEYLLELNKNRQFRHKIDDEISEKEINIQKISSFVDNRIKEARKLTPNWNVIFNPFNFKT